MGRLVVTMRKSAGAHGDIKAVLGGSERFAGRRRCL